jgi:hypothetical protein
MLEMKIFHLSNCIKSCRFVGSKQKGSPRSRTPFAKIDSKTLNSTRRKNQSISQYPHHVAFNRTRRAAFALNVIVGRKMINIVNVAYSEMLAGK